MTGHPTLEDLDAAPDDGPWCCNGNAEDCALCVDPNPNYPWICPEHERTAANERIVGEAAQATEPCGSSVCGRFRTWLVDQVDKAERADQVTQERGGVPDELKISPHNGIAAGLRTALLGLDRYLTNVGATPMPAAEREQQLVDAHRSTIGELRAAEERVRLLEERLRLTTDEKVANVVGPNIELLCGENARLRAEVAAARKFAGEMRNFCSPHAVAAGYADQLEEAMDRAKEGRA